MSSGKLFYNPKSNELFLVPELEVRVGEGFVCVEEETTIDEFRNGLETMLRQQVESALVRASSTFRGLLTRYKKKRFSSKDLSACGMDGIAFISDLAEVSRVVNTAVGLGFDRDMFVAPYRKQLDAFVPGKKSSEAKQPTRRKNERRVSRAKPKRR